MHFFIFVEMKFILNFELKNFLGGSFQGQIQGAMRVHPQRLWLNGEIQPLTPPHVKKFKLPSPWLFLVSSCTLSTFKARTAIACRIAVLQLNNGKFLIFKPILPWHASGEKMFVFQNFLFTLWIYFWWVQYLIVIDFIIPLDFNTFTRNMLL